MIKQTTFKLTRKDADALFRVRKIANAITYAKYGDGTGYYLSEGDLIVLANIGYGDSNEKVRGTNLMSGWDDNSNIKFEHAEEEEER